MRSNQGRAFLLAAAVAAACGQPYVPMRTALLDTRAPPEVDYANEKFVTNDGVDLYEQRWTPSGGQRGAVVLVHGLKDHSTRYRDLAITMAQHGLAVEAFDVRGHGYSAGVRDHVVSLDHCLGDLDRVVGRVRLRSPDKPLFLLGQGFGGTVVGVYAVRAHPKLAGLVLSAPTLHTKVQATERFGTAMAGIFAPRASKMSIDYTKWSTDRSVVQALREDPLVAEGDVTAGTARALLAASDELEKHIGEITVPLLILDGEKDEISDHQAIVALAAAARTADKTFTVYPGLTYDLFHETARDQITADTIDWVQKHAALVTPAAAPTPSPTPPPAAAKPRKLKGH
jgi:acylglycerol lipase